MTGLRYNVMTFIQIIVQCVFHFFSEINNCFIAAFPPDFDTIILEINIADIKPDTF